VQDWGPYCPDNYQLRTFLVRNPDHAFWEEVLTGGEVSTFFVKVPLKWVLFFEIVNKN
jgi:hypothetical protein